MFVDQPTSNPPQNIPTGFRWEERHGEAHGCIGEGGRPIPNGHEDVIKRCRAAKIRMLCGCCGVGGGVARASGMSDGACGGGAVPHVCVHVVVMFPM